VARDDLIRFRRGTEAAWTAADPVLDEGEPGFETDTNVLKLGDGATAWSALSAVGAGGGGADAETIRDTIATALVAGSGITITVDDPGNTITVAASGGGGSALTVSEAGTPVDASVTTIDFGAGFDVSESPEDEVNISLDLSEYTGAALPIASGGTGATSAGAALTALGAQPLDSDLTTIAGLTATTDNFMVATASAWASRTPSQARTQMGLGSLATASTINDGNWSGTDLAVANGGTGASDASTARTNLGLVIGTNVQAHSANLTSLGSVWTPASAASQASLLFHEDTDNGTNYAALQAPVSLTTSPSVVLPSATTVLVGNDTTDTLTNKTISGSSNTLSNIAGSSLSDGGVTNAKLANVATSTIKGRVTASTGVPEDLTGTQATTLLDVFTTSLKGLAPASGGGTSNFLRADGTWAAPPGGGGGISGITVAEGGSALDTDITSLDFGNGFDLTESPENEVNIDLDLGEYTGTDLPVASGGTGASDASGARTNLGLVIGTNVQAFDADLTTLASAFTTASASGPASLAFREDTDNGTNQIVVEGQSALAADVTLTLPGVTSVIVGDVITQTLTNKTFDLTSNTLVGSVTEFNDALESANFYTTGGTDVALADGGTGASLTDPGADRILFWDDSAGVVTWLEVGTNLSISTTTLNASGGGSGIAVEEDNVSVDSAVTTLDFGNGLDVATDGADEVNITVDLGEYTGTDLPVSGGGTGASDATTARSNLGLVIGTNVQAYDADLTTLATAFTSASAAGPASLDFHEDTDFGTNRVRLTTSGSVADVTVTIPAATDTLVGQATTDTLTNKTLTSPQINGGRLDAMQHIEYDVNVVAASGATETLDTDLYNWHVVTMDQSCTFTFSNPAPSADGTAFLLELRGAFTPTFPASVDWADATAPTYTTPSLYTFVTRDAGTTWLGFSQGKAFG
jgi:hypothetical protein